ncbi:MAG: hypothetical protein JSS81_10845 [Acidobacteria bacterium]|nr:hypothetical protein [Acidobacteriota bacterium]
MSNLSDIGFPTPDDQAVNEMIMHVLEVAKPVKSAHGFYLVYTDPSGAEIYLQGNFDQELIGFNPHFAGRSRRTVALTKAIERDSSVLDGGFYAWANPADGAAESGDYPFVFDVPDFRAFERPALPRTVELQLTAFASNDFKLYANDDDYQRAQESELKYASKMFVPSGLFGFNEADGGVDLNAVRPVATFAGEIRACELKTNTLSGESFYALLVDTLGGETDVVVDPKYVPAEPMIGSIVSGTFWLSGRFI